jgi:ubiquinone/menaquinone biosynthesis C-methylase UbiE
MNHRALDEQLTENLVSRYDEIVIRKAHMNFFENSHFLNYGYWESDTFSQKQACENLMDRLLSYIPDKKGNILDVACGAGGTTQYLLKYFPSKDVTAINISEKQLERAKINAPGCSFLLMNATQLEFADALFDNIICVESAFHFNTRNDFLQEAFRVLKPGGYLVLSDILMTLEAERKRPYRIEKNYIKNLEQYSADLYRIGYHEVVVDDVTEACWKGHFWGAVRFFHQQFLDNRISQNDLGKYLDLTYRRVPDTQYYVFVSARKPV